SSLFKYFIKILRPAYSGKIPGRKKLSTRLLNKCYEDCIAFVSNNVGEQTEFKQPDFEKSIVAKGGHKIKLPLDLLVFLSRIFQKLSGQSHFYETNCCSKINAFLLKQLGNVGIEKWDKSRD
ncbi:hypothetical protein BDFB_012976, partial [Asbolus verrucosus]